MFHLYPFVILEYQREAKFTKKNMLNQRLHVKLLNQSNLETIYGGRRLSRRPLQPKSLPGHATWTQIVQRCRSRHRSRDGDGGSGKTPVPNTKELM